MHGLFRVRGFTQASCYMPLNQPVRLCNAAWNLDEVADWNGILANQFCCRQPRVAVDGLPKVVDMCLL